MVADERHLARGRFVPFALGSWQVTVALGHHDKLTQIVCAADLAALARLGGVEELFAGWKKFDCFGVHRFDTSLAAPFWWEGTTNWTFMERFGPSTGSVGTGTGCLLCSSFPDEAVKLFGAADLVAGSAVWVVSLCAFCDLFGYSAHAVLVSWVNKTSFFWLACLIIANLAVLRFCV